MFRKKNKSANLCAVVGVDPNCNYPRYSRIDTPPVLPTIAHQVIHPAGQSSSKVTKFGFKKTKAKPDKDVHVRSKSQEATSRFSLVTENFAASNAHHRWSNAGTTNNNRPCDKIHRSTSVRQVLEPPTWSVDRVSQNVAGAYSCSMSPSLADQSPFGCSTVSVLDDCGCSQIKLEAVDNCNTTSAYRTSFRLQPRAFHHAISTPNITTIDRESVYLEQVEASPLFASSIQCLVPRQNYIGSSVRPSLCQSVEDSSESSQHSAVYSNFRLDVHSSNSQLWHLVNNQQPTADFFDPRRNSLLPTNLPPIGPVRTKFFIAQDVPDWLVIYSRAPHNKDHMLKWELFQLPQLDSFDNMLLKLYKQEMLDVVGAYERYRAALSSELEQRTKFNENFSEYRNS